jgi:hypothetical protein
VRAIVLEVKGSSHFYKFYSVTRQKQEVRNSRSETVSQFTDIVLGVMMGTCSLYTSSSALILDATVPFPSRKLASWDLRS